MTMTRKAAEQILADARMRTGAGAAFGDAASSPGTASPMATPAPPPGPAPSAPMTRQAARAVLAAVGKGVPQPTADTGQGVGPPGTGREPDLVHEPGGEALFGLQPDGFNTIEELYRTLPDDSWFLSTVTPSSPIQFEIGAFQVPQSQNYWMFDYEFSLFRFSGVDAGDMIKAERGRFSGVLGFDLTINGQRPSHLLYQLDPQPAQIQKSSFGPNPQGNASAVPVNNVAAFNRSSASSFAAAASQGLSVLPVRRQVQGAAGVPFTMVVRENERVALSIVIFKRIKTPIAAVEARHGGYLLQSNLSQSLIQRVRPR